jgi:predicted N-formylglutamate amidohydrolase
LLQFLIARTRLRAKGEPHNVTAGVLNVRLDEPYSANHPGAYVTRRHAGPNVYGVVIEVCDELLDTPDNIQAVKALLCSAIQAAADRVDRAARVELNGTRHAT